MKQTIKKGFWGILLCLFVIVSPLQAFAKGPFSVSPQPFELLQFKHDLDRANLALVLDWLGNDLKQHETLNYLVPQLEKHKQEFLEQIPIKEGALNYEALIIKALAVGPTQEAELRRLIRYSVDYLNLEPAQKIEALKPFFVTEKTSPTDFELRKGFPTSLLPLRPESLHTIVGLQHYNRRRLGRVPLEYALASNWPVYLFDCAPEVALAYLQAQGFDAFYQLNAFYSRWGKEVFLARRGSENVLVYADIYGSWMEDHLLYMLRSSVFQGKTLDPQNVFLFHTQGATSKSRFLTAYRHDLEQLKQENTILVLGYFGLMGREIKTTYRQSLQHAYLKQHLDQHQVQYQLRYSLNPEQTLQKIQVWQEKEGVFPQPWQEVSKRKQALQKLLLELERDCESCALQQELKQLTSVNPGQRKTGQALLSESFRWQDSQGKVWNMLNLGANHSLYGDMTRDLVGIALELGIREVVFAGSAGAVRTDFPVYSLVFPAEFRDYRGQVLSTPNYLSLSATQQLVNSQPYLSYGTVHQGVRSPVAETQALIRSLQTQKVDTLDVEVAEIARVVSAYPDSHFSAALLVTDYPGAFLKKQDIHLDQVNYHEKYKYLPVLIYMLRQKYHLKEVLPLD